MFYKLTKTEKVVMIVALISAIPLGIFFLKTTIGILIGLSVSGAIWYIRKLKRELPIDTTKNNKKSLHLKGVTDSEIVEIKFSGFSNEMPKEGFRGKVYVNYHKGVNGWTGETKVYPSINAAISDLINFTNEIIIGPTKKAVLDGIREKIVY